MAWHNDARFDAWLTDDGSSEDPLDCDVCGSHMDFEEDADEHGSITGRWICKNENCGCENEEKNLE